jgi:hypothetical protein
MDPATIADLPTLISPPRLAPYLAVTSGQAEALRLYTWNVEVSSAFWGVVNALEVALRNSMQDQLATRFGRRDWWDLPSAKLAHEQAGQLRQARKAASKAAKARKRAVVPDDVVAQFMLGFWVGLLGRDRHTSTRRCTGSRP